MFIGRKEELSKIEKLYRTDRFQMPVISHPDKNRPAVISHVTVGRCVIISEIHNLIQISEYNRAVGLRFVYYIVGKP